MSDMLREIINTMQVRGEPRRRWFASESFDLMVWLSEIEEVIGFQLCYGKSKSEHAVTWRAEGDSLAHMVVDDGEAGGGGRYKSTPILTPCGEWDPEQLLREFLKVTDMLPEEIMDLVVRQLEGAVKAGKGITFNSTVTLTAPINKALRSSLS